jgi:hypothetical protein
MEVRTRKKVDGPVPGVRRIARAQSARLHEATFEQSDNPPPVVESLLAILVAVANLAIDFHTAAVVEFPVNFCPSDQQIMTGRCLHDGPLRGFIIVQRAVAVKGAIMGPSTLAMKPGRLVSMNLVELAMLPNQSTVAL